jgi:hypothetical protein
VEDEWSLCYDAQLDFSDIGSLNEYESSDEDNQSELPQNYGCGRGRRSGHGSTTPLRPI